MATEHTLRRAGRMQAYPAFRTAKDEYITVLLEDALACFLDYTHRSEDPGEAVDSLICDIARSMHTRMGAEGVRKAKDGELEREWSEQGGLDPVLLRRMKAHRLVVGINATPSL